MSRFLDRISDLSVAQARDGNSMGDPNRPFRVLTIANNKGGIGKTMLAANLAVYLRALREDLPILVIGLDDQDTLDRMFAMDQRQRSTVLNGFRAGNFSGTVCEGKYGIHYVPSCDDIAPARKLVRRLYDLETILYQTNWQGLVILDTKSDFDMLARAAVFASDLTLVVVKDQASLVQAKKVFDLLRECGRPRESSQVILSMVDRRIRYREAGDLDVLGLLVSRIRNSGFPLLESFVSHSPKVASLETNPDGSMRPVLIGAPRSIIHRQLYHVAHDVLKLLDRFGLPAADRLAA